MGQVEGPAVNGLPAEPGFVSMSEACRFLGIGRATGYELVERDEFPVRTLRLRRRIVVSRAELLALAAGQPR